MAALASLARGSFKGLSWQAKKKEDIETQLDDFFQNVYEDDLNRQSTVQTINEKIQIILSFNETDKLYWDFKKDKPSKILTDNSYTKIANKYLDTALEIERFLKIGLKDLQKVKLIFDSQMRREDTSVKDSFTYLKATIILEAMMATMTPFPDLILDLERLQKGSQRSIIDEVTTEK